MLLTIASLTVALIILAIKYARLRVEVSELYAEVCAALIELMHTRKERDEARAQAMPRIDADKLLKSIRAEREEEANCHGVEL